MMRNAVTVLGVALLLITSSAWAGPTYNLTGDYLEARSSSVYAGPCHYEGEFETVGREATMVWHIREGAWNDTSLAGLTVVAVVAAEQNLSVDMETRKSVLYIDESATISQRQALQDLFTTQKRELLGNVVKTKTAPIHFSKMDLDYRVRVGESLALSALSYPCQHCTERPYEVWYKPFESIQEPVVGKATFHEFTDKALNVTWKQTAETNSVFVGEFTL